jgi:hypothetical protein
MKPFKFLEEADNENDVTNRFNFLGEQVTETVTFFWKAGNENDLTVPILYLVSNGNEVTVVTCCGNDAHEC